jgi:hypothetical protein
LNQILRDSRAVVLWLACALAGCSSTGTPADGGDAGARDGSALDTGHGDGGAATDGAATDGAATDGAATDGAATDGGGRDGAATDGGGRDDAGVMMGCRRDSDCASGQLCCVGTGRCYDPRCLSCCMGTTPMDAGHVCTSNRECGSMEYCAGTGCDTPGTCAARPTTCSDIYEPVCGCNGMTYRNGCEAARQGVRVASPRPCGGGR